MRSLFIPPEQIPIYPGAYDVAAIETTSEGFVTTHTWRLTTVDSADDVWHFYETYFDRTWGFYPDRTTRYAIIGNTCPSYYVKLRNASRGNHDQDIELTMSHEPCR